MKEYLSTEICVLDMASEQVICGSPVNGGSEDVGYEDWGSSINSLSADEL